MKSKIKKFYCPVWQLDIFVIVAKDEVAFSKIMKRRFDHDTEYEPGERFQGHCINLDEKGVVIGLINWKNTLKGYAVLAHECFHAVEYILGDRDTSHCGETSESWAYLLDTIFFESARVLK